jgi:demethylmenaquinone methyltransferase/2-methoxy-6-polyprenyl-1,4-benzoquinol methylase
MRRTFTHASPSLDLVEKFFSGTGASYDAMVHYLTLGIDARWKRQILACIPVGATRILDLASGTGILTFDIARRFPSAEVEGVELREEYLAVALEKQKSLQLPHVSFHLSRAEDFVNVRPVDCVVSSYLAKYADLPRLAAAAACWLNPDGMFIAHDFTLPPNPILLHIWRVYFWLLQKVGGPLLPAWREIFYGLPPLIAQTRWVEALSEELRKHGFQEIRLRYLTLYGSAILTAKGPGHASEPSTRPALAG